MTFPVAVFPFSARGDDVLAVAGSALTGVSDDAVCTVCSDGVVFVAARDGGVVTASGRLTPEQIELVRQRVQTSGAL